MNYSHPLSSFSFLCRIIKIDKDYSIFHINVENADDRPPKMYYEDSAGADLEKFSGGDCFIKPFLLLNRSIL